MGPVEIGHRIAEQVKIIFMRLQYQAGSKRFKQVANYRKFRFFDPVRHALPELDWMPGAEAAAATLSCGEWHALGYDWKWQGDLTRWDEAPDTGNTWPRSFFTLIPYRAGNPYGDIRVAWEPARLQQLVGLALAARSASETESRELVALLEEQFLSWVEHNPPLQGIHYISAMECALRLIAVCHAFDMIRAHIMRPDRVFPLLLALVEQHASFIFSRLSLHSSAGNHTIAECAGLVYAGNLFPEFRNAHKWRSVGLSILTSEYDRQVLNDGGGLEQAFWYHLFVTDLCGLVAGLLEYRNVEVPKKLDAALLRAREFLNSLAVSAHDLPRIGDADGGYALSGHLGISWKPKPDSNTLRTFPESGYSVVTQATKGITLLFDHGPLGMPPSYGHGHADALSISMKSGQEAVLVDPGTCTYTGRPELRQYFRGTLAHNTVCIDGLDQAVQDTAFQWSSPFLAELVSDEVDGYGNVRLLARHTGYLKCAGTMHWRGILLAAEGDLLVWDWLDGAGEHDIVINWHAAVPVEAADAGYILRTENAEMLLSIHGLQAIQVLNGSDKPIAGWQSVQYGQKNPINTIRASATRGLPVEICSRFTPVKGGSSHISLDNETERFRKWIKQVRDA
jgi:hypothetical protein